MPAHSRSGSTPPPPEVLTYRPCCPTKAPPPHASASAYSLAKPMATPEETLIWLEVLSAGPRPSN
ncbi:hypothetical protein AXX17_AT1G34660 [Arabidopsis thaliana]|uniref:Uncharacterized protein n=1 Tax=Arabidopsis thaliana TaxID=3702 RepID=A0A178WDV2_ARATH|nr:hypothetical protein AXX17_AT1G34660 [Arabidopsis thaliana]